LKIGRGTGIALILLTLATVAAIPLWRQHLKNELPIKVGILQALSGPTVESERPLVEALQLAIEDTNAEGGIKGQKIQAVMADCGLDAVQCADEAERLITQDQVKALFGCWTSTCRKAVKEVVEKHHHLLFYALRYEGMEQSPNILYGGAVPNQLIMPAVHWALVNLGNRGENPRSGVYPGRGKRVYLVGSENVFSRVVNILIKDLLAAHGAILVNERYLSDGISDMSDVAIDISNQDSHIVLNTLSGSDNASFFRALETNGITAARIPVLSFSVTEVRLSERDMPSMTGHYAARNYFQSISIPENQVFVRRFHEHFGEKAVVDGPSEASYINLQMWVQAALEAGSADVAQVQRTILRQSMFAPEGVVAVDPVTRHVWKIARIGQARNDGQFDIVWDSGRPLEPAPYPTYRSREDWDQLLKSMDRSTESVSP
jgi:urea transport system substrate-binding protein